jgi:signal transduction histidine kinase
VRVTFEKVGANRPVPGRIETGLYRIAQEALSNVEQHADTHRAWLRLTLQPDQIVLVVEDDGQGFDPAQAEPGHFGVIGMVERAKLLGGSLELESSPGEGARIQISVPLR